MELLKERIRKDGVIKEGNVLKVDNFLNHQMDIGLFNEIGREFKRRFADERIDKILTIEASGIGIAAIAAQYFGVPVVFAKKAQSINLDGTMLSAPVESFTHKRRYEVIVASRFLRPGENILIIDDFLANGCAAMGLCQIVEAAHARVAGIGIVIEKGFQCGGKLLQEKGLRVESLAIVDGMDAATQTVQFRD
ncbi:MAG: xanthine phosphoribosyltransferase [Clostridiaceae bacterium]|nr:xanthine phosphoribosyltransferase [Clostridiaceae bacterium]